MDLVLDDGNIVSIFDVLLSKCVEFADISVYLLYIPSIEY
jgi:hypothetical protein